LIFDLNAHTPRLSTGLPRPKDVGGAVAKDLAARTVVVMPFYAAGAGSGHSIADFKHRYLNITVPAHLRQAK